MAFIWSVMLAFSNEEFWEGDEDEPRKTCAALDRVNAWIPHGKLVDLAKATYARGASFGMDANLFGGGFKHFDIDAFIKVVEAQEWKDRSKVKLWVKGWEEGLDGDEGFVAVRLRRRPPQRSVKKKARPGTSTKKGQ